MADDQSADLLEMLVDLRKGLAVRRMGLIGCNLEMIALAGRVSKYLFQIHFWTSLALPKPLTSNPGCWFP
jgi:hypothetical protein